MRSSQEVRGLILEAARELFSRKGFDETTTRDIAKKAGVTEALLFTNFGSKSGLFDAAIVTPFSELVADYVDSWNNRFSESTPEERIKSYIENFYDLATRNRPLLLAALFQRVQHSAVGRASFDPISHLATVMHNIGDDVKAIRRDYPQLDPPAGAAVVAGMVLGVALLDEMLFPKGARRPGRARIVDEMTQTILHGVEHRGGGSRKAK